MAQCEPRATSGAAALEFCIRPSAPCLCPTRIFSNRIKRVGARHQNDWTIAAKTIGPQLGAHCAARKTFPRKTHLSAQELHGKTNNPPSKGVSLRFEAQQRTACPKSSSSAVFFGFGAISKNTSAVHLGLHNSAIDDVTFGALV